MGEEAKDNHCLYDKPDEVQDLVMHVKEYSLVPSITVYSMVECYHSCQNQEFNDLWIVFSCIFSCILGSCPENIALQLLCYICYLRQGSCDEPP